MGELERWPVVGSGCVVMLRDDQGVIGIRAWADGGDYIDILLDKVQRRAIAEMLLEDRSK